MRAHILTPVLGLIVWTFVMWFWMYATRIPAMRAAGLDPARIKRKDDIEVLPVAVKQVADNYNHLHEQPTVFYAAVLILVLAGYGLADVLLAWAYVAVRVVHSVWQATVNRQPARAMLFLLSSLFLVGLGVRALLATLA